MLISSSSSDLSESPPTRRSRPRRRQIPALAVDPFAVCNLSEPVRLSFDWSQLPHSMKVLSQFEDDAWPKGDYGKVGDSSYVASGRQYF